MPPSRKNPAPTGRSRNPPLFYFIMGPYLVYAAYLVYGAGTHRGLMGWIEDLSMRLFHWSRMGLNLLLAMFAGIVVCSLALATLYQLKRALFGVRTSGAPRGALPPKPTRPVHSSALQGARGLIVGTVVAVVALAGTIALAMWAHAVEVDPVAPAPALDLDSFSRTPPASSRVALGGWFHDRLTVSYEEKTSGRTEIHDFTPVTSTRWKPGEPVSVILETTGRLAPVRPGTTLNVRLRPNDLPAFVKNEYERSGMRLTDPYWVADRSADQRLLQFILGLGLLVVVLALSLGLVQWRRRRPRSPPLAGTSA